MDIIEKRIAGYMAKVNYHFKSTQRNASIISFLSVLLFVIYSFVLFICYQSDIVALSHFIESDFVSPSPEAISEKAWAGALLTTLLCLIPALLLLRCIHFPLRLKALALFPSYIILGLITGIAPHSVDSFESEIPIISTTLSKSTSLQEPIKKQTESTTWITAMQTQVPFFSPTVRRH